jgi:hypothetical protein
MKKIPNLEKWVPSWYEIDYYSLPKEDGEEKDDKNSSERSDGIYFATGMTEYDQDWKIFCTSTNLETLVQKLDKRFQQLKMKSLCEHDNLFETGKLCQDDQGNEVMKAVEVGTKDYECLAVYDFTEKERDKLDIRTDGSSCATFYIFYSPSGCFDLEEFKSDFYENVGPQTSYLMKEYFDDNCLKKNNIIEIYN